MRIIRNILSTAFWISILGFIICLGQYLDAYYNNYDTHDIINQMMGYAANMTIRFPIMITIFDAIIKKKHGEFDVIIDSILTAALVAIITASGPVLIMLGIFNLCNSNAHISPFIVMLDALSIIAGVLIVRYCIINVYAAAMEVIKKSDSNG